MSSSKRTFISLFVLTALAVVLSACASTSAKVVPPPAWMPEPEAVFPKAEYIVQIGDGVSEADAQTQAVQAIGQYISTTVESNLVALKTNDSFDYANLIRLTSDVDMFGLQITEGWYSADMNKWYAVAYINRDEAWTQYVPVIDQAKREFYAFYDKAEAEEEPFIAYHYLDAAWNASFPFLTALETGRLIDSNREKAYNGDREKIAEIPARQKEAFTNATLTLTVEGDSANTVTSCLSDVFSTLGFTISKKTAGAYTLDVIIEDNAVTDGEMTLVYPSLELDLTNRNGRVIFSWACALGKSAAYSPEKARQRGLAALVEEINANVPAEFSAEMNAD